MSVCVCVIFGLHQVCQGLACQGPNRLQVADWGRLTLCSLLAPGVYINQAWPDKAEGMSNTWAIPSMPRSGSLKLGSR